MYAKVFKKYLDIFAKYLYFHSNTLTKNVFVFVFCIHEIAKYLYLYSNTFESILPQVCSGEEDFWRVFTIYRSGSHVEWPMTITGITLTSTFAPYKIWLWLVQQFQRRRHLIVTDGQTTEAAYPISFLNGFWEIQPYMNWRGWGMPLWIHSWWPQGHNLNNLSSGLLDKITNQTSKGLAKKIFTVFPNMGYVKRLTPWAGPFLKQGLLF